MELESTGYATVLEHETLSGVIVRVTPLSVFTHQAMVNKAKDKFPYPDPEPYRLPLENAVDPLIKQPAEDNPEYKGLMDEVNQQRDEWLRWTVIRLTCTFPAYPTPEALIKAFRSRLDILREVADLDDDDWQNAIQHCVFTGRNDRDIVIALAIQRHTFPLSMPEVVDGIRMFRVALPGNGTRKVARNGTRRTQEQSES